MLYHMGLLLTSLEAIIPFSKEFYLFYIFVNSWGCPSFKIVPILVSV